MVEHLICNQRVGGSSPFAGSTAKQSVAGVVEWLMAPGCKPGGLTPYVGSNPTPCTGNVFLGGCSSVGRASAFQAEGREFESRRPLQFLALWDSGPRSSGVERLLGKEEVMSSNLIAGSSVSPGADESHAMILI